MSALLLTPFLTKAHTIDDATFLLQAEHVLRDPLHPTAFEIVADGERVRLSWVLATGPVMAYLLVPAALWGGAEWLAHAVQLGLLAAAILVTVSLGLRSGLDPRRARLAGLLLATTPAVLALATTSMADVPAMAFGVLGIERLYAWKAERRGHQGLGAAVALALAGLSRSHLVLLLGVGALALWGDGAVTGPRRRLGRSGLLWAPLLGAALLAWLINRATADPAVTGFDVATTTLTRFAWNAPGRNLVAFAVHWVLVLPLAIPWFCLRWRALVRGPWLWLGTLAAAVLLLTARQARWTWIAPVAGVGAAVLADVLHEAWRRRDHTQLVLGSWLLLALPVVGYVQLPSKYLVPSAPAVALLVARVLGPGPAGRERLVMWGTLVAGATLGVLIIRADAHFADIGRQAASEVIAPLTRQGIRVWADAGWGFMWYAIKAGAQPLALGPPLPDCGDVVVSSAATPSARAHEALDRHLLRVIRVAAPGGRVMSVEAGAGFYTNHHGYLPWAWGNDTLETITVWRIC